ncbi:tRNA-dihydrouridine(20/20a) synthase [Pseudomonas syringae pv. actinidiae]|nr:tRNA-dihydrouridine(20/20a) synthase [Pseudomonas syringae pv. actinidiae]
MMDWTDHHCRYFMRLLSSQALLYTEMVTTGALLHGDRERFLRHDETEHPLALQLGGSTAADLAACARLAEEAGYDEVNLNVGCPSDRVQNNMIGACLMAHPQLVADCVKAMRDAVGIPVTVKHRIGINGRDSYAELCDFVGTVHEAGCQSFTVHARIAILEGLSPKENRDIPPLRYDVVAQLKTDFPELEIVLNGGIKTLEQCSEHLQTFDGVMLGREAYHNPYLLAQVDQQLFGSEHLQTFDGVMLGREAYHNPYLLAQVDQQLFGSEHLQTFDGVMLGREAYHNPYLLAQVDQQLFGSVAPVISRHEALESMRPYIAAHIASGGNMHHVTRHMLGLGLGFPGARRFRQLLSVDIHKAENPLLLLDQAAKFLEGH